MSVLAGARGARAQLRYDHRVERFEFAGQGGPLVDDFTGVALGPNWTAIPPTITVTGGFAHLAPPGLAGPSVLGASGELTTMLFSRVLGSAGGNFEATLTLAPPDLLPGQLVSFLLRYDDLSSDGILIGNLGGLAVAEIDQSVASANFLQLVPIGPVTQAVVLRLAYDGTQVTTSYSLNGGANFNAPFGFAVTPKNGFTAQIAVGAVAFDYLDPDGDGIASDGDASGLAGDLPCPVPGETTAALLLCDDNCPLVPNADQADVDGDGIGDACTPPFCAAQPDGTPCGAEDVCRGGECHPIDPSCRALPEGSSCSDGDACTDHDVCQLRQCTGTRVCNVGVASCTTIEGDTCQIATGCAGTCAVTVRFTVESVPRTRVHVRLLGTGGNTRRAIDDRGRTRPLVLGRTQAVIGRDGRLDFPLKLNPIGRKLLKGSSVVHGRALIRLREPGKHGSTRLLERLINLVRAS